MLQKSLPAVFLLLRSWFLLACFLIVCTHGCGGGSGGSATGNITGDDTGNNNNVTGTGTVTGKVTSANFISTPQLKESRAENFSQSIPVIGATVFVAEYPSIRTLTDDTGTFTLTNIPAGSVHLIAEKVSGYITYRTGSPTITVIAGRTTTLQSEISLVQATAGIGGKVINIIDQPIEGATLTCLGNSYTTGSDGIYKFENLPVGTWKITCSRTNYVTFSGSVNIESASTWVSYQIRLDPDESKKIFVHAFKPARGGTIASTDNPRIYMNRPPDIGSGKYRIYQAADDQLFEEVTVARTGWNGGVGYNNSIILFHEKPFEPGVEYYILIDPTCFKDSDGNYFEGINDKNTWRFYGDSPELLKVYRVTIYGHPKVTAGCTSRLKAVAYNRTNNPLSDRTEVTWSSSNTQVATVSNDGVVTGISPGTTTISASIDNVTGTLTFTVTDTGWKQLVASAEFSPREKFGLVELNDALYLIGGYNDISGPLQDVWKSTDGENWTRLTEAAGFGNRYDFGCTVYKNRIWVIGGKRDHCYNKWLTVRDVWYSTTGIDWIKVTDDASFSERAGIQALVWNDAIYIIGGYTNSPFPDDQITNSNLIYRSTDGAIWTLITPSSTILFRPPFIAASPFKGNVFVVPGGGTGVFYTSSMTSWTLIENEVLGYERYNAAMAVHNNTLYVVDGLDFRSGYGPYVYEGLPNATAYTTDGTTWYSLGVSPKYLSRSGHRCISFRGRLLLIGGYTIDNPDSPIYTLKNDIWYLDLD